MAKEITLHIDGQEVTVPEGTTILQAAETLGIEIPRLCYFEGLPASGSCRLCLVEIEGQSRLAVSCMQRAREGMIVQTASDRVLGSRRFILELIWSTHDGDCTTCEKAGACDLQRYTYDYDVDKRKYGLYAPEEIPSDLGDPLIERGLRLCILCGRCIRACREKSQGILDFMERGMSTIVTTSLNKPLIGAGCDFCGSCIEVCPVGCLVERDRKLRGREWEFESDETICGHCSLHCDLILDRAHGDVVRARPGTDGYLCVRGKFGWDYLASEDRVDAPLVRKGDGFEEVSWGEALDRVAQGLAAVSSKHGAGAVRGLVGPHVTNETVLAFGDLLRDSLGTGTIGFAGEPVASAVLGTFGTLTALADVSDLEKAKKILAVGPAVAEGFPRARLAIKRAVAAGAKLLLVDGGDSELAEMATVHLRPKAGQEASVLGAIAAAWVDGGVHDADALGAVEGGPEALAKLPRNDAAATGISDEQIAEAAKAFAKGKGVIAASDVRPQVLAECTRLLMLSGRLKHALLPLHRSANPWADVLLGGEGAIDLKRARGLLVVGTAIPPGLQEVEFLVVQDLFLTEGADKADVVLPLRGFVEDEGAIVGPGGKPVVVGAAAPTGLPPAWQTAVALAEKLGKPLPYKTLREVRMAVKERLDGLGAGRARFPEGAVGSVSGRCLPYGPFDLPEPSWSAHSQLHGGRMALGARGTREEVAA